MDCEQLALHDGAEVGDPATPVSVVAGGGEQLTLANLEGSELVGANPLTLLSDQTLRETQLSIALLCLRSRSVTRRKHSEKACALLTVLKLEGDRRGIENAHAPYRA